ncbi:MAG: hypothetical protein AAFW00_06105 [Bacteroidota bacterium]
MDTYAEIPIIILGSPQAIRNQQQLRRITQELQMIEELLLRYAVLESFELIRAWPLGSHSLVDVIHEYKFNPSVKLIHLAGSAESSWLPGFDDDLDFAAKIGQFPYLQTLYLSGFASPNLLETLLNRDIPAIIATDTTQNRQFVKEIANGFYAAMGKGEMLREALTLVKENYPQHFVLQPVAYDIEANSFDWKGRRIHLEKNKIAWGVYALEHRADLGWQLPIPKVKSTANVGQGQIRQRRIRRVGLGVLTFLMMGFLIFMLLQILGISM